MRCTVVTRGALLLLGLGHVFTPIAAHSQEGLMDRQAIEAHVYSIFEAYQRQDAAAIRATHTEDWTGFLGQSRTILRGIGQYMENAERTLEKTLLLGYEFTDMEIRFYGEVALLYYTARIQVRDKASGEERVVPIRSLDVYRKGADGWNQVGSHIGVVPGVDGSNPWAEPGEGGGLP